jgi:hypothetical protein
MGMREIAPFGVRMPPELKERIESEARANGRSMNTEVIARLWDSLKTTSPRVLAEPSPPAYIDTRLSDLELKMLESFRRLGHDKQLAMLTLMK